MVFVLPLFLLFVWRRDSISLFLNFTQRWLKHWKWVYYFSFRSRWKSIYWFDLLSFGTKDSFWQKNPPFGFIGNKNPSISCQSRKGKQRAKLLFTLIKMIRLSFNFFSTLVLPPRSPSIGTVSRKIGLNTANSNLQTWQ